MEREKIGGAEVGEVTQRLRAGWLELVEQETACRVLQHVSSLDVALRVAFRRISCPGHARQDHPNRLPHQLARF